MNFSSRVMLVWVMLNLIMTPLAFSLEGTDSEYTSDFRNEGLMQQSAFSQIVPIVNNGIYAKSEVKEESSNIPAPDGSLKTSLSGKGSNNDSSRIMILLMMLFVCLVYLYGYYYLRWSSKELIIASGMLMIVLMTGCWATTASGNGIHFGFGTAIPSYPTEIVNNQEFSIPLNITCTGEDCTNEYLDCIDVTLSVILDKDWDAKVTNVNNVQYLYTAPMQNDRKAMIFSRSICNRFSNMFPIVRVTPHTNNSLIDLQGKSYNVQIILKESKYMSGPPTLTRNLLVVSDDPDSNKDLCTASNGFIWNDDGRCCGDDFDDCGRLSPSKKMICTADKNFMNWTWYQAVDGSPSNKEHILEIGCGHYEVMSTGATWISCSPEDAMQGRCLFSMDKETNAHASRCGLFSKNVICDPPFGYKLECRMTYSNCNNPEGEIELISLEKEANSHVGKAGHYQLKVCCTAWDKNGTSILTPSGAYKKEVLRLYSNSNSHAQDPKTTEKYDIPIYLSSTDPAIESFDCKAIDLDTGPKLLHNNCVASLSNESNAHVAECGYFSDNLYCEGPVGYDLSCAVRDQECVSSYGEVEVLALSNNVNAHAGILSGAHAGWRVCCSAKTPDGENMLSVTGQYKKNFINISDIQGGHAEFSPTIDFPIHANFSSSYQEIENFNCYLAKTGGDEVAVRPDYYTRNFDSNPLKENGTTQNYGQFADLFQPRCLFSLTNQYDAHVGACGAYRYNLYALGSAGYDINCRLSEIPGCLGNEYEALKLYSPMGGHVGLPGKSGYNTSLCCNITNSSGQQVLTPSGTYKKSFLYLAKENDSHVDFFSYSEFQFNATFPSNDSNVALSLFFKDIDSDKTSFIPSIDNIDVMGFSHDYLCRYTPEGDVRIAECQGTDDSINPFNSYGMDAQIESLGRSYYCTGDGLWKSDLDNNMGVCIAKQFQWIGVGDQAPDGYCCGDDTNDYFNYPMDSLQQINIGAACWKSRMINNYELADPNVLNHNGTFYGCNLDPTDPRLLITDARMTDELIIPSDNNMPYCTSLETWYCDTDGKWKNVSSRLQPSWNSPGDWNQEFLLSINITNGVSTILNQVNPQPDRGCCPAGFCWNQFKGRCATGLKDDVEEGRFTIENGYVCWNGTWEDVGSSVHLRNDWDGDVGFCDIGRCSVRNITTANVSFCTPNESYISDFYCNGGNWSTRPSRMANELMQYISTGDDFVVMCDNYENILPYIPSDFTQTLSGTETNKCISDDLNVTYNGTKLYPIWEGEQYKGVIVDVKCTNRICVLRKNDANGQASEVYFGISYNNYGQISDPNFNIHQKLSAVSQYYNNVTPNMIIYKLNAIHAAQPPSMGASLQNLIGWMYDMFVTTSVQSPQVRFPETSERLFYARTSTNEIYGAVSDPEYDLKKNMLMVFTCFNDTDLSAIETTSSAASETIDYIGSNDTNMQSLISDDVSDSFLDDNWLQLTAMIRAKGRTGECNMTGFCLDSDGLNASNAGYVLTIDSNGEFVKTSDACEQSGIWAVERRCVDGALVTDRVECIYGCENGKCRDENPVWNSTSTTCRSTGSSYFIKDATEGNYTLTTGVYHTLVFDRCAQSNLLYNFKCIGNVVTSGGVSCDCEDGACKCTFNADCGMVGYECRNHHCVRQVAYYNFDSNALDSTVFANHGTVNGPVLNSTAGINGSGAYMFNANGQISVDIPAKSMNFNFRQDSPFSISAFIRIAPGSPSSSIVSKMKENTLPDGSSSLRGYDLMYFNPGGSAPDGRIWVNIVNYWNRDNNPLDNYITVEAEQAVNDGRMHNIIMTYDGSMKARGVNIYIDGKRQNTKIISDSLTGPIINNEPFRIGSRGTTKLVNGTIDEVKVFGYELSPENISHMYPPTLESQIMTSNQDVNVTYDMIPYSYDVLFDATNLIYSLTSILPASNGCGISIDENHLSVNPIKNFNGECVAGIMVTNPSGLHSETIWRILISQTNQAPVASDLNISMSQGAIKSFTLPCTDANAGDVLTYTLVNTPFNGIVSAVGKDVDYIPNENFNGTDTINFTCNDGHIESNIGVVTINVTHVNEQPNFHGPIPNQTWKQGHNISVAFDLDTFFQDPEGHQLTYNAVYSNNGLVTVLINQTNGLVSLSSLPGFFGIWNVTFTASDGELDYESNIVYLNVTPNHAPVGTTMPTLQISQHGESLYNVNLSQYFSDPDTQDTLTYQIVPLDPCLTASIGWNTGLANFTASPSCSGWGLYHALVCVYDQHWASACNYYFYVEVGSGNVAPTIAVHINKIDAIIGSTTESSLSATFFDYNGDPLTYEAGTSSCANLLTSGNSLIIDVPSTATPTTCTGTVRAYDGDLYSPYDTFDIELVGSQTNIPLAFNGPIYAVVMGEGVTKTGVDLSQYFSGSEGAMTFTITPGSTSNVNASINTNTGVASFTSHAGTANPTGPNLFPFTVIATSAGTAVDGEFNVNVMNNPQSPTPSCSDPDGHNYANRGTITYVDYEDGLQKTSTDTCRDISGASYQDVVSCTASDVGCSIEEYYCDGISNEIELIPCDNCNNGICTALTPADANLIIENVSTSVGQYVNIKIKVDPSVTVTSFRISLNTNVLNYLDIDNAVPTSTFDDCNAINSVIVCTSYGGVTPDTDGTIATFYVKALASTPGPYSPSYILDTTYGAGWSPIILQGQPWTINIS